MNSLLKKLAIPTLRWTVGIVVLFESLHFVLSAAAAHHVAKVGLPLWVRPVLGGSEIVAALFFLIPYSTRLGGWLLIAIFGVAIALHLHHLEFDSAAVLLIYGIAVLVCIADSTNKLLEARHVG